MTHAEPADSPHRDAIVRLWSDALHVDAPPDADHFFDRGGHSLNAMRFLASVGRVAGAAPRFAEFFADPTLGAVLRWVARHAHALPTPVPVAESRRDEGPVPLTPGLFRFHGIEGGRRRREAYNEPSAWRLLGPFDPDRLARAWDAVVERTVAWISSL